MEEVPRVVADDLDYAAIREKGGLHAENLPELAQS